MPKEHSAFTLSSIIKLIDQNIRLCFAIQDTLYISKNDQTRIEALLCNSLKKPFYSNPSKAKTSKLLAKKEGCAKERKVFSTLIENVETFNEEELLLKRCFSTAALLRFLEQTYDIIGDSKKIDIREKFPQYSAYGCLKDVNFKLVPIRDEKVLLAYKKPDELDKIAKQIIDSNPECFNNIESHNILNIYNTVLEEIGRIVDDEWNIICTRILMNKQSAKTSDILAKIVSVIVMCFSDDDNDFKNTRVTNALKKYLDIYDDSEFSEKTTLPNDQIQDESATTAKESNTSLRRLIKAIESSVDEHQLSTVLNLLSSKIKDIYLNGSDEDRSQLLDIQIDLVPTLSNRIDWIIFLVMSIAKITHEIVEIEKEIKELQERLNFAAEQILQEVLIDSIKKAAEKRKQKYIQKEELEGSLYNELMQSSLMEYNIDDNLVEHQRDTDKQKKYRQYGG